MGVCISRPSALCLAPGSQFVFTGPGPQLVFTDPDRIFTFTDPNPQFVFTNPDSGYAPICIYQSRTKFYYYYHSY